MTPPHHAGPAAAPAWASGFYKLSVAERRAILQQAFPEVFEPEIQAAGGEFPLLPLSTDQADNMVENCVGTMGLPVGVGLNFVINGRPTVVPMAVEEPSVIAAASNAAKTILAGGGFAASTSDPRNVMIAQVQILDLPEEQLAPAAERILAAQEALRQEANSRFCASMAKRGGGLVSVTVRTVDPARLASAQDLFDAGVCPSFEARHARAAADPANQDTPALEVRSPRTPYLVVHLLVAVCEAMGANVCNTVAEGLAPMLERLAAGDAGDLAPRAGLRILSNLAIHRLARASFRVPVAALARPGSDGLQVAQRIVEAAAFAHDDPFRAATHNKGIMNGVGAAAVALGQDWRAVEAGAHAFCAVDQYAAKRPGSGYQPMTQYWVEGAGPDAVLRGEIELPLAVGTKGGAVTTVQSYRVALALAGSPTSAELSHILACVGLAQNFAAVRALSLEGINRGHMALHARNIAVAAGVPTERVTEAAAWMITHGGGPTTDAAKAFLAAQGIAPST
ncbi:hypothetical protein H696_00797 [Fonticula alba]|uniref:3-hydroxy-3-methylglutaryl coenzyme A reductase n=1 Tax=Fonticula alba TaxID=691883 RepID=A0A058ZH14_FONAL|nr:hypothetical protein H696_00797 [Fonticula alba]KCV73256.1 hypothetical protein H696_00797 [Fonticula alba]|eukprot:XP_009492957.1 hypothetical protein H696_00797 [Fonticula alba]